MKKMMKMKNMNNKKVRMLKKKLLRKNKPRKHWLKPSLRRVRLEHSLQLSERAKK